MTEQAVHDNQDQQRYELEVDGHVAFADYERQGDRLLITHTFVPGALRGQGVAGRLVAGLVADVRARGLKIVPLCSYIVAWFERHPDARDLLAD